MTGRAHAPGGGPPDDHPPGRSHAPGAGSLDVHPAIVPATASAGTASTASRARLHAHLVLRQMLEVLDGRRPAAQLADVVTEPVLRYLTLAAGRLDAPRYPAARARRQPGARRPSAAEQARGPGLRSMHVCHPSERVAEVSVVWRYRGRFRALAARFELPDERPLPNARTELAVAAEPARPEPAAESGVPPAPSEGARSNDAGAESRWTGSASREPRWRCTALRIG